MSLLVKVLIMIIATLVSLVMAFVAGTVIHAGGASVAKSITGAGVAFAGTMSVALGVLSAFGL